MPGNISFYYAIFKKLQAATGNIYAFGQEHFNPDENDNELAGGFSLNAADSPYGVFGALSAAAPTYAPMYNLQQGWQPLNPNSNVPAENPLYVLLEASTKPPPLPWTVPVNGQDWPVMPQPDGNMSINSYANWKEFLANGIIASLGDWITKGKLNDTPKAPSLTHAALVASPPKAFGFAKANEFFPILFVASFTGDDGRRPGDGGVPAVPANYVPAHFWNTSRIYLTDEQGKTVFPQHLQPTDEYYVAAVIGNSGNNPAGRIVGPNNGKIVVVAEAQLFNSGWGPAAPPLPTLSNLNPASTYPVYEQYHLGATSYDVIGFRFNVDWVLAGLKTEIANQGINLGGLSVEEWLNDSHPCVKVLINAGEPLSP